MHVTTRNIFSLIFSLLLCSPLFAKDAASLNPAAVGDASIVNFAKMAKKAPSYRNARVGYSGARKATGKAYAKRTSTRTLSNYRAKKQRAKAKYQNKGRAQPKYAKKKLGNKKRPLVKRRVLPPGNVNKSFRKSNKSQSPDRVKAGAKKVPAYLQNKVAKKQNRPGANSTQTSKKPAKKAAPHVLVNALKGFKSQNYQFGNNKFKLDKAGLKHILERHHPTYWNGTAKGKQTFFTKRMSVAEVNNAIKSVMNQNRTTLAKKGNSSIYQIRGSYRGTNYVLGLNNGRVGQFFPH